MDCGRAAGSALRAAVEEGPNDATFLDCGSASPGAIKAVEAITSAALVSDTTCPSTVTSATVTSDFPDSPTGSVILRFGSAMIGMAQAPGAIEWPSVNAAAGGSPRIRMKLLRAMASAGPT